MKLLLTGPRGVGKSTLIARVIKATGARYGGFRTERTPDGTVWLYDLVSGARTPVGRYDPALKGMRPLVKGFETLGVEALQRALEDSQVELTILDELGRLEAGAVRFRAAIRKAFQSTKSLLGVLQAGQERLWAEILSLPGVELIEVTRANREGLAVELSVRLSAWGKDENERADAAKDRGLVAR